MEYYTATKKELPAETRNEGGSQVHCAETKKPDTHGYILQDSIYRKF